MIEQITYKTKIEELLNLTQITEIISKFTKNFEQNYSEKYPNNQNVSKEIANINKKIIEIAVTQRKKELEKLLEMTIEKIKELDKELQEINAELLKVKNPNSIIVDQKQKHYEYSQILKATNELKLHLEDKKRQICAYLSIL